MRRYSDSALTITATGAHFSTAREIHVTLKQPYGLVDLTNVSVVSDTELIVMLSQSQTAQLKEGNAELQINYIDAQGMRRVSDVAEVNITKNLLQRVIQVE